MIAFFNIIHTLITRFCIAIALLIIAIPLIICLLSRQPLLVDNRLFCLVERLFYWVCIKFSFLPISYKGLANIPHQPCIIIANHQSGMDIPLVGYALGARKHVWLSWSELVKGPLLGFIVPRVSVLVDTTTPMKGMRTLVQAIDLVKTHPWDLIIFPEGSRFTDGTVHPFFGGFAHLAKKVDRPVVPIKIIGVDKVYPPNAFWGHYNPITVIIGKPFALQEQETEDAFKERVYQWFTQDNPE